MSWVEAEIAFHCGQINRQIISRSKRGTTCLRNSASQVLGQNGTGRVYKNGHVASSPGQPPAPDTGSLRRHWREAAFVQSNGLGTYGIDVKLRITSDTPYAKFLQHGTRFIAPRPFIERIRDKSLPEIQALFSNI